MYDYEQDMIVIRSEKVSEKNVPYIELLIENFCGYPIDISFRAYPKNVFIVYEDNRGNMSSGCDLLDCWLAPIVLYKKIPRKAFSLSKELDSLKELFDIDSFFWDFYKKQIMLVSKATRAR